jgi:hypothetical protein
MSYTSGVFLKGRPISRVMIVGRIYREKAGGIKNNNIIHPKRTIKLDY